MGKTAGKPGLRSAVTICACFLLTSTGYLAWVYHVMEMVSFKAADAVSMVGGYAMQAVGLCLFMLCPRRRGRCRRTLVCLTLILHMLCLVPAVLSRSLFLVLFSGGLLNLFCGLIAGYYLFRLTSETGEGNSAITLGTGYGAAILLTWLLSRAGGGTVYYTNGILVICLVLTVLTYFVTVTQPGTETGPEPGTETGTGANTGATGTSPKRGTEAGTEANARATGAGPRSGTETGTETCPEPKKDRKTAAALSSQKEPSAAERNCLFLAGILILLFSMVNSCGFAFPSADLGRGVNLEATRLFYAAGLLIAGLVNDRSRKHGAVCALAALVIPFIMLALKGEPVPLRIFWALSYFTFGFYSIYRMILFSDIARRRNLLYLCGFGLLAGRAGDAAGEAICLSLSDHVPMLIGISALLFVICVFLFFRIYPGLYLSQAPAETLLKEKHISDQYQLYRDTGGRGARIPAETPEERGAAEKYDHKYDPRPGSAGSDGQEPGDPVLPERKGPEDTEPERPVRLKEADPAHAEPEDPEHKDLERQAHTEAEDQEHKDLERQAHTEAEDQERERERFYRFCARFGLSGREREVLRQLLAEKTNKEIADLLSISEGTVKYHIHNLLQKTGCRNRGVLLSVYYVGREHVSGDKK